MPTFSRAASRAAGSGNVAIPAALTGAIRSLTTTDPVADPTAEVEVLFDRFHEMVTGKTVPADRDPELGRLAAFSGVSEFPARVKCATLAWHTLRTALEGGETVSTE